MNGDDPQLCSYNRTSTQSSNCWNTTFLLPISCAAISSCQNLLIIANHRFLSPQRALLFQLRILNPRTNSRSQSPCSDGPNELIKHFLSRRKTVRYSLRKHAGNVGGSEVETLKSLLVEHIQFFHAQRRSFKNRGCAIV